MRQWQIFNSETFHDHNGQPSFVRKSLAWVLLFGGGLIVLGVLMFGVSSLNVSKEIASFILKALAAITGVVGIAYGAMQGAKGYAQGQAARSQNPPNSLHSNSRAAPKTDHAKQEQTTQNTKNPEPKSTNSSGEKQDQSSDKKKQKEA